MNDLISVIIPVYNVEPYLERCIDSVLRQTYEKLEIIVIDDGSTDRSGDICDRYAAQDARIKVIHQQNAGLSAARNTGISLMTGECVIFVDSDDYMADDFVAYLYDGITKYNAQMCVCNYCNVNEDDVITGRKPYFPTSVFEGKKECMTQYLQFKELSGGIWSKMYRKELFAEVRFPVGRIYEDVATVYRLVDHCERIVALEEYKFYYRSRDNSIMHSPYSSRHLDSLVNADQRCEFIKDKYPDLYYLAAKPMRGKCRSILNKMNCTGKVPRRDVKEVKKYLKKYYNENSKECAGMGKKLLLYVESCFPLGYIKTMGYVTAVVRRIRQFAAVKNAIPK